MRELLVKKLAALQAEAAAVSAANNLEEIEAKVAEYRQSLLDADAKERAAKMNTLEIKCAVVEEMLAEAKAKAAALTADTAAEEPTAAQEDTVDTVDTATYGGGYVHITASNEVNL